MIVDAKTRMKVPITTRNRYQESRELIAGLPSGFIHHMVGQITTRIYGR